MTGTAPSAQAEWSWPIDLDRYDRTSTLHQPELELLDRILTRSRLGPRVRFINQSIRRRLERLLAPIDEGLHIIGATRIAGMAINSILLKETARRRVPFWGWSEAEWVETICPSATLFSRRQKRGRGYRNDLIAVAYLLRRIRDVRGLGIRSKQGLAEKIFGQEEVKKTIASVVDLIISWGAGPRHARRLYPRLLAELMLLRGSPRLLDLTPDILEQGRQGRMAVRLKKLFGVLAKALAALQGLDSVVIAHRGLAKTVTRCVASGVPEEWARWCVHWYETATGSPSRRRHVYYNLLIIGRWLADCHPELVDPGQWTRDSASQCVAVINSLSVGQYCDPTRHRRRMEGKPLTPSAKHSMLGNLRVFFHDLQENGRIERRFDPFRALATPPTLRQLIAPNPRVIADEAWAKLLHAGLNLTAHDLPLYETGGDGDRRIRAPWYPLDMVRAIAAVWLFAGLRNDEIVRLRLGCLRWQRNELVVHSSGETLPANAVCLLAVPTNKTSTAFTKPVDPIVGRLIVEWEKVRPAQPLALDVKTGEMVHYLFSFRGQRLGGSYLNGTIIPLLCRKAGVPKRDATGPITSHRARSTVATQLYNAKDAMSLFELMEWLGHRSPSATQQYAKVTPTKLAKAYADADYFRRNLRTIEVLIDRDAVLSGSAAQGKPWQYFDLGHGFCTYDFFEQCPHRLACAKCSFYLPKEATAALLEEGKVNLNRMQQEIKLTDDERSAVDDGIKALTKLAERLTEVPAPDGYTRSQLVQLLPRT
jgi:integrase